jgi:hypothetical protein
MRGCSARENSAVSARKSGRRTFSALFLLRKEKILWLIKVLWRVLRVQVLQMAAADVGLRKSLQSRRFALERGGTLGIVS